VRRAAASDQNLTRDFLSAFESALHVHLGYRNDQSAANNEAHGFDIHRLKKAPILKGKESYQPSAERQFSDARLPELPTPSERF
jgi:hypothetical protein